MNLFREHVLSLPNLIETLTPKFEQEVDGLGLGDAGAIPNQIYLTGCGDSYFAAGAVRFAFESITGIPSEPQTAMQFSRYAIRNLADKSRTLVIGISVSGGVSRTVEAILRANRRQIPTLAITSSAVTPLGKIAGRVAATSVPDIPNAQGVVVPGARSFYASMLMLVLIARAIGAGEQVRSQLATQTQAAIRALPEQISRVIEHADTWARAAALETQSAGEFLTCGSGPSFSVAQFCAAKIIEASGDSASAQDIEEWAHLQYFAKTTTTPTIVITWPNGADASRAAEVITAMNTIGRKVIRFDFARVFDRNNPTPHEWISPFLSAIPGMLFAAHRSEIIGEPYFRSFGGGRSIEGGGGVSRIRTSEIFS